MVCARRCRRSPPVPRPPRPSSFSRRSAGTGYPTPGKGAPGRSLSEKKPKTTIKQTKKKPKNPAASARALQPAPPPPRRGGPAREQRGGGGVGGGGPGAGSATTSPFHKQPPPPPLRRPGVSPFMWAGVFTGSVFFFGRGGGGGGGKVETIMIYDKRLNSGNLNSNARFDWRQHKTVALLAVRGAGAAGTAPGGAGWRGGGGATRRDPTAVSAAGRHRAPHRLLRGLVL